jgi:hypothetical protein
LPPPGANIYYFYQTGFQEGAFYCGAFTGTDDNGDGRLISNTFTGGDITEYIGYFSGNSIVSEFQETYVSGFSVVLDLDCGSFDDPGGTYQGEGIATNNYRGGAAPVGPCGQGNPCAVVGAPNSDTDTSSELIKVTGGGCGP